MCLHVAAAAALGRARFSTPSTPGKGLLAAKAGMKVKP
jgi:hypothetical protein